MLRINRIARMALAAIAVASAAAFAQIATIKITTQDNKEPTATQADGFWGVGGTVTANYVKVTSVELSNAGIHNFTRTGTSDSIRVRGNSTAVASQRPYRIKFGTKQRMFGREAAKSWVLLANFYDGTLAMNAVAFRLGQRLGLDFTPSSEFVEVYINGQLKGVYQLTEQMQVNPGRVDIREKKDWFVEFDYHDPDPDHIKFFSDVYKLPTRVRSPEVTSNFTISNPDVKFVADEINALCNNMNASGFPNNGYRDRIDLESYAKYVLIQQLTDNWDFNNKVSPTSQYGSQMADQPGSNYAYRDSTGKIKAGPLWDFDLAAGVVERTFPNHHTTFQEKLEPRNLFYKKLWSDPLFLAKFKKIWDRHQDDFEDIPRLVDSISGVVGSRLSSSDRWASGTMTGTGSTLTLQRHNSEVAAFQAWWPNRLTFFGNELNKLNIDVSIDIDQASTVTVVFDAKGGSPTPATQTVVIGQKATQPTTPTKSGETFGGWYTDGGNSTGTFNDEWDFATRTVTGKVTLYAKWSTGTTPPPPPGATFTVTFSMNGSSSAQPVPDAQTVPSGGKAARPTEDPARNNYFFGGWFKEAEATTPWDFDADAVTANTTIYAKWSTQAGVVTRPLKTSGKSLTAIRNGFIINTASGASMTVFSLNGSVARKQAFARGNHTVRLGDLPSGVYLVKSNIDGVKRVAKIAVR